MASLTFVEDNAVYFFLIPFSPRGTSRFDEAFIILLDKGSAIRGVHTHLRTNHCIFCFNRVQGMTTLMNDITRPKGGMENLPSFQRKYLLKYHEGDHNGDNNHALLVFNQLCFSCSSRV